MKIFLLIFVVSSVKAQNSFDLQFLGDSLSLEEATDRELCGTRYCLSDAKYLFSAATQNKSVRPCDDFKEFALGTFEKYQSVNDRTAYVGFLLDVQAKYYQKGKRVLSEPVNVNDSRISKEIKKFFAKCVNSKNIRKNGVREAREYMRSFGLKFYPEKNEKDFDLKNFIEQQGTKALRLLFFKEVNYYEVFNKTYLYLQDSDVKYLQLQFKKEFDEIAFKQTILFQQLKYTNLTVKNKKSSKWMTIEKLNNLTSPLNLNWLTIINNQLFTKINSSAQILVSNPQSISKIAEFIAKKDKDAIADYLVYDLLYELIIGFVVYAEDKYQTANSGASRPNERWRECQGNIISRMAPAVDALYLQRYFNKKSEDSLRKFSTELIEFFLRKFKSTNQWGEEVLNDVTEKLQSVKFIFGYSDEFVGAERLEELYGDLDFDQSSIETWHQMQVLHEKLKREHKTSELLALGTKEYFWFPYLISDNIIYIDSLYLDYPFYHYQRPRYYNIATVGTVMFESVFRDLREYLNDKYNLSIPYFEDQLQYGYEFYESWLESGGEELNLGANRLTNRQLYWVAVASTLYRKHQAVKISFEDPEEINNLKEFHKYISKNPGFKEAYNCKK